MGPAPRFLVRAGIVLIVVVAIGPAACASPRPSFPLPGRCPGCTVLAEHRDEPHGIALDNDAVYWTDRFTGSVLRIPKSGGSPQTLFFGSQFGANDKADGITVQGDYVYWANPDSSVVARVAKTGGASINLATNQAGVDFIVSDAANLYWTNAAGYSKGNAGSVMSLPLPGGTPIVLATATNPRSLALDGNYVYWVDGGTFTSSLVSNKDGALMRVPIAGGTPEVVASGLTDPYGIAVDATNVYFTGPQSGVVGKVPLGGGPPVVVASGQNGPQGLAVDAKYVYWTVVLDATGNGGVMMAPLSGGPAKELAGDQNEPLSLALDDTNVYWTDPGDSGTLVGGMIVTIAKPR
jgi:hypothetical protein